MNDAIINDMKERGQLNRLYAKYLTNTCHCVQNTQINIVKPSKKFKKGDEYELAAALVIEYLYNFAFKYTIRAVNTESKKNDLYKIQNFKQIRQRLLLPHKYDQYPIVGLIQEQISLNSYTDRNGVKKVHVNSGNRKKLYYKLGARISRVLNIMPDISHKSKNRPEIVFNIPDEDQKKNKKSKLPKVPQNILFDNQSQPQELSPHQRLVKRKKELDQSRNENNYSINSGSGSPRKSFVFKPIPI